MLGWLKRAGGTQGWLAVSVEETGLALAHARRIRGARALVSRYGFDQPRRDGSLARYRCSTLLRPGEYEMVLVEAPNVPRAEMKSALRWKVKDLVDYPVDEATVDFLDIPREEGRTPQMYAVLARNEILQGRIDEMERAGVPLQVIEVPETAQRNVAALYDADRAAALVHFSADRGLLTITHRGELYLSRRLDVGADALAEDLDTEDGGPLERVALEIQRTLDHFERQFRHVAVGKLLVAPLGGEPGSPAGGTAGLCALLQSRFEMPVQAIDLAEVLAFDGRAPDATTQWRLFHHFGAALREDPA